MDIMNIVRTYWDRIAAVGCTLVGALLLFLGWRGVSDSPYPAGQIPYVVSDGFGGLFLLGVAAILWISADLRDEWAKLDSLDQHLENIIELAGGEAVAQNAATTQVLPGRRARPPAAHAPAATSSWNDAPEGTA